MVQTENNNGLAAFLGALVVAGGLLYVSGWYIAWDDFIATKNLFILGMVSRQSSIINTMEFCLLPASLTLRWFPGL
ncbi:hypothetical protein [Cellvibrio sp. PSBB006]|uniref:hypothetical protein n=1 Tax=Cellvibrio sp. PSBB006 TaxID=1987723 RepID=UPI001E44E7D4|nr:hypothetical protein [Cellvibrio sp. PSBB006]